MNKNNENSPGCASGKEYPCRKCPSRYNEENCPKKCNYGYLLKNGTESYSTLEADFPCRNCHRKYIEDVCDSICDYGRLRKENEEKTSLFASLKRGLEEAIEIEKNRRTK